MLQGIKKTNSKRPPLVSQIAEEKLVRHKCICCKKQFLAYRRSDHHDLKTCDDCLISKEFPDQISESNFSIIEKPLLEVAQPISHAIQTPSEDAVAVSRVCEMKEFFLTEITESDEQETVEGAEKPDEDITVPIQVPARLGSYSVRHKVMQNDHFLSIGDIVSVCSEGTTYYAQITAFIESVFCDKYAALIWLLPTTARSTATVGFDPFAFIYGPEDESFYDVRQLKFVMHPPTQFYKRFIPPVPKNSDILTTKHKYKMNFKRKS